QSGSTRTLRRMLRRYSREGYMECVARLRAAMPSLAITTDIIVGFPGESEAGLAETLSVVEELASAAAFTFIFSARDGTPATRLPASMTISAEEPTDRLQRRIDVVRDGAS